MAQTFEMTLPDPLVEIMKAESNELPRRTLEALVAQLFRTRQITHYEASQALGLDRWETDGFLNDAKAFPPEEIEEFLKDYDAVRASAKQ